jgi:hypothetical protein
MGHVWTTTTETSIHHVSLQTMAEVVGTTTEMQGDMEAEMQTVEDKT